MTARVLDVGGLSATGHEPTPNTPVGNITPRTRLWRTLPKRMRPEYEAFEAAVLEKDLKRRRDRGAYEIDRRNRRLGHAGRLTLRDPDAAGGPDHGRTTADHDTAVRWAKEHYIPALWRERVAEQRQPGSGTRTVREDCEHYLAKYHTTLELLPRNVPHAQTGPRSRQSRFSMIRQHVVPELGAVVTATLTASAVNEVAAALTVERTGPNGEKIRVPAAPSMQRNFITALRAVWALNYPDDPCPFELARVPDPDEYVDDDNMPDRVFDHDRIQEELREEGDKSAVTSAEFETALVGAMHYDAAQMQRPCIAASPMIPNTVHLFVALVALGVRISEARRIRWADISFEGGYVLIHVSKRRRRRGKKKKPRIRVVPLQEGHVPWLRLLQREQGITDVRNNTAFVYRTSRRAEPTDPGALTTFVSRAAKALAYAGVKPPGKATHWGRATYATWGKGAPGVKGEELQHFLGHIAFSGSTEEYIAMMIEMLRPAHRRFIKIPSPARVRQLLKTFTPAETTPWRKRRKVQSRSRAARAARAARRIDNC